MADKKRKKWDKNKVNIRERKKNGAESVIIGDDTAQTATLNNSTIINYMNEFKCFFLFYLLFKCELDDVVEVENLEGCFYWFYFLFCVVFVNKDGEHVCSSRYTWRLWPKYTEWMLLAISSKLFNFLCVSQAIKCNEILIEWNAACTLSQQKLALHSSLRGILMFEHEVQISQRQATTVAHSDMQEHCIINRRK